MIQRNFSLCFRKRVVIEQHKIRNITPLRVVDCFCYFREFKVLCVFIFYQKQYQSASSALDLALHSLNIQLMCVCVGGGGLTDSWSR